MGPGDRLSVSTRIGQMAPGNPLHGLTQRPDFSNQCRESISHLLNKLGVRPAHKHPSHRHI